jgi:bifunctional DNase/RNase
MDILGLSTSPSSGGAYALILNEMDGNRRLPIIIGTFEAQAIALELERIKPPRPMTHDLLRSVIQGFGSYVKSVLISELRDGTFFAQISLESDGNELELDARPSDAIALAIQYRRRQIGQEIKRSIRVGDTVKFYHSRLGLDLSGPVKAVKIKNVTVSTVRGLYRVPANLLEVV